MTHEIVFLFDVDNTLLDNDRVSADLKRHLTNKVGAERQARYWTIFEQLRGIPPVVRDSTTFERPQPRSPAAAPVSTSTPTLGSHLWVG